MKREFKLVTSLAAFTGVLALNSCNKTEEIPTPATLSLNISVTEVTTNSAHVEITPSNDESTYYFDLLSRENYNNVLEAGVQAFLDAEIDRRVEASGASREEAFARIASKGPDTYDFTNLQPAKDYVVIAFGVHSSLQVCTDLFDEAFSTEIAAPSDNVLEITVDKVYDDGVDYTVNPSNEDTYLVDVWPVSLVDELGDFGTIEYYMDYNGFMLDYMATSGEYVYSNERVWQPGRDYYVIAFGYADGEATTRLFKKEFRTEGGDPAKCTFTFDVTDIRTDRAEVKVVPSDKQVVYIWDVLDVKTFDKYTEEQGSILAAHKYVLEGLIEQTMGNEFTKRQLAVEMLGRWSGYTASDDDPEGADIETIFDLEAGTEYIVWAVPVDADGKPETDFASVRFTTAAE